MKLSIHADLRTRLITQLERGYGTSNFKLSESLISLLNEVTLTMEDLPDAQLKNLLKKLQKV